MGKNNQQRRAAKAKQRHRRGPTGGPGGGGGEAGRPAEDPFAGWAQEQSIATEAYEVLQIWAEAAERVSTDGLRRVVERELSRRRADVLAVLEGQLVDELSRRVAGVWEAGWEPRDLVHVAAKTSPRLGVVISTLIVMQARLGAAATRAPRRWLDQLSDLGFDSTDSRARWRPVGEASDGTARVQVWTELLMLLTMLAELVSLEPIGPTPSQWAARATATRAGSTNTRDRMLNRIRALLAKAEATTHPAEAESFTAKAQELMTRHAIDEAVLRNDQHEEVPVEARRVHLQAPYATVKGILLGAVARPNRCRTILLNPYDIAALVGTPLDVDHVELLFTSLLIQATRAMAEAGHRRAGSFDRSATFRRSFLTAYATRIAERLEEADRSTTATFGTELVPVLQREADAVAAEFDRRFPHTRTLDAGYLDPRGWTAGREAADRAAFVAGRLTA